MPGSCPGVGPKIGPNGSGSERVMPEISVIVVNWNGRHLLEDCLGAMRRQTFRDFETILVDNGSTDGSIEYVQSQFPEVKLVALPENRGFTGGNIAGYEAASGRFIALLNNDTEVHEAWLRAIYEASMQHPDAGSFASKMMYFDNRERIENCGFDLGISGVTIDLGRDEIDGPAWSKPCEVFGACGGAVAYRRSMLQDIGFLDPDFFAVYEDVDLSFRARLRGYGCIYVPRAVVFHRYRATLGQRSERQVFYSQRNIELVYFKNMPTGLMLRSMPQRILYELGAAIHFARLGHAGAFLRGKLSALKLFLSVLKKRNQTQKLRTVPNSRLLGHMRPAFHSKWKKFRHSST
jgi:GT2 family glycosyltransferase